MNMNIEWNHLKQISSQYSQNKTYLNAVNSKNLSKCYNHKIRVHSLRYAFLDIEIKLGTGRFGAKYYGAVTYFFFICIGTECLRNKIHLNQAPHRPSLC